MFGPMMKRVETSFRHKLLDPCRSDTAIERELLGNGTIEFEKAVVTPMDVIGHMFSNIVIPKAVGYQQDPSRAKRSANSRQEPFWSRYGPENVTYGNEIKGGVTHRQIVDIGTDR